MGREGVNLVGALMGACDEFADCAGVTVEIAISGRFTGTVTSFCGHGASRWEQADDA